MSSTPSAPSQLIPQQGGKHAGKKRRRRQRDGGATASAAPSNNSGSSADKKGGLRTDGLGHAIKNTAYDGTFFTTTSKRRRDSAAKAKPNTPANSCSRAEAPATSCNGEGNGAAAAEEGEAVEEEERGGTVEGGRQQQRGRQELPKHRLGHACVYTRFAHSYHTGLCLHQDYNHNLPRELERIGVIGGEGTNKILLELGAGTGKLSGIMAPSVLHITACDKASHMCEYLSMDMARRGITNVSTVVADNSNLPFSSHIADSVVAGWSICEDVSKLFGNDDGIEECVRRVVGEMTRCATVGGIIVIIETLGCGYELPRRTGSHYYKMLTERFGFQFTWVRTDYMWESKQEAHEAALFFYGPKVASMVTEIHINAPQPSQQPTPESTAPTEPKYVLLECTGIWWKKIEAQTQTEG